MKKAIYMTLMVAIVSLVGFNVDANAQRRNRGNNNRINQRTAANLIKQIENGADKFKRSLERGLDRSRLDDSNQEDRITDFVSEFENATDRLRNDYADDNNGSTAAQEVLRRGQVIDRFMRRQRLASNVERDWNSLRGNLDQLARLYRISWNWNGNDDNRYNNGRNDDRRGNNGRYNNNRNRINYNNADTLIRNIETKADRFKRTLDRDLDRSRANNTRAEDRINDFVSEFEQATNQLRSDYRDDNRGSSAVSEVLQRGRTIDSYMRRLRGSTNSKREWNSLRGDLDQLARLYNVSWNWGR